MHFGKELKIFLWTTACFVALYFLPLSDTHATKNLARFDNALLEAFALGKWYAREHVLLCLVPAFYIAGAVSVFVSKASVMRYLGPSSNKLLAYGVASVSGTILAVCSCTILPLFSGIYKMGAGLGPASAFLYSGPAISVLSIVLTANVLGLEIGLARGIGAIGFSVVIGVCMQFLFRNEAAKKQSAANVLDEPQSRPLWQTALYFASMIGILVFANWAKPDATHGLWFSIWVYKWRLVSACAVFLGVALGWWFKAPWWKVLAVGIGVFAFSMALGITPGFIVGFLGLAWLTASQEGELRDWFESSWDFAKQILPLLLGGVLIAGFLLGRVGHEGILPSEWITQALGGNSLAATLFASIAGVFMYFATLTEIPIIQGLLGAGMGKGPALALLLAGPALSLPSMLIIAKVIGVKKTFAFVALVVVFATISGMIFGYFA